MFQSIAPDVKLGENVRIFDFVNLYGCTIGDNSKIGAFVEIQKNAHIGKNCKISSHTFICEGVTIEDDVFVGHNVSFINDKFPRATKAGGRCRPRPTGRSNRRGSSAGASIGTSCTILSNVRIGKNTIVGAGQRRDPRRARQRHRGRQPVPGPAPARARANDPLAADRSHARLESRRPSMHRDPPPRVGTRRAGDAMRNADLRSGRAARVPAACAAARRTPRVHAFTHARIVSRPGRVLEDATLVVRDGVVVAVGRDVRRAGRRAHLGLHRTHRSTPVSSSRSSTARRRRRRAPKRGREERARRDAPRRDDPVDATNPRVHPEVEVGLDLSARGSARACVPPASRSRTWCPRTASSAARAPSSPCATASRKTEQVRARASHRSSPSKSTTRPGIRAGSRSIPIRSWAASRWCARSLLDADWSRAGSRRAGTRSRAGAIARGSIPACSSSSNVLRGARQAAGVVLEPRRAGRSACRTRREGIRAATPWSSARPATSTGSSTRCAPPECPIVAHARLPDARPSRTTTTRHSTSTSRRLRHWEVAPDNAAPLARGRHPVRLHVAAACASARWRAAVRGARSSAGCRRTRRSRPSPPSRRDLLGPGELGTLGSRQAPRISPSPTATSSPSDARARSVGRWRSLSVEDKERDDVERVRADVGSSWRAPRLRTDVARRSGELGRSWRRWGSRLRRQRFARRRALGAGNVRRRELADGAVLRAMPGKKTLRRYLDAARAARSLQSAGARAPRRERGDAPVPPTIRRRTKSDGFTAPSPARAPGRRGRATRRLRCWCAAPRCGRAARRACSRTPTCCAVGGKIRAVGPDLAAPPSALVDRRAGKHVTPGLIDCHSHSRHRRRRQRGHAHLHRRSAHRRRRRPRVDRHLPRAGRRRHRRQPPARFGQHDRRPERGDQAALGRDARRHDASPARRPASSSRSARISSSRTGATATTAIRRRAWASSS